MTRALTTLIGRSLVISGAIISTACTATFGGGYVELKKHRFSIEVANDEASRERGLMFRDHLDSDHGMLFIFQREGVQTFWMKNTRIPLDIIYFDTKRQLINTQNRVPPCTSDPCPVYPSTAPAMYVLELNAGAAEKLGLKPGDELSIHP